MHIVTESDGSQWISLDSLRAELKQLLTPDALDQSTLAANRTLQYLLRKLVAVQPNDEPSPSEPMQRALAAIRAVGDHAVRREE